MRLLFFYCSVSITVLFVAAACSKGSSTQIEDGFYASDNPSSDKIPLAAFRMIGKLKQAYGVVR